MTILLCPKPPHPDKVSYGRSATHLNTDLENRLAASDGAEYSEHLVRRLQEAITQVNLAMRAPTQQARHSQLQAASRALTLAVEILEHRTYVR